KRAFEARSRNTCNNRHRRRLAPAASAARLIRLLWWHDLIEFYPYGAPPAPAALPGTRPGRPFRHQPCLGTRRTGHASSTTLAFGLVVQASEKGKLVRDLRFKPA